MDDNHKLMEELMDESVTDNPDYDHTVNSDGTTNDPPIDFGAKPEETNAEGPTLLGSIAVNVFDTGFQINIDPNLNFITVAGIAWYLTKQAEIAMGNQLAMDAHEERLRIEEAQKNQRRLLVPMDHLGKGGKKN